MNDSFFCELQVARNRNASALKFPPAQDPIAIG